MRLKAVRGAMGLSLRKFAEKFREDFTLLARIEAGKRFPPKSKMEQFAKLLSLSLQQLDALIAVERRGLDPYELLPEMAPAHIPQKFIENEAEKILGKYRRTINCSVIEGPMQIEEVIKAACGLNTQRLDFTKEKIPNPRRGALYGCLYPDSFRGTNKLVLVNTGNIGGRRLSDAEQRITVAHEAGHYVLHCGNKENTQLFFRFTKAPSHCREVEFRPTPFNSHEDQASAFAACLLMPQNQFKNEWVKVSGDKLRLARHFGVTESFVSLRAKQCICE
jgi:transcriptional regulator with XRE-family HTH domain